MPNDNLKLKIIFISAVFLVVLFLAKASLAAPAITSVSGTLSNGQTITISGSGFGAKTAAPLISSYDNATSANNFSTGSIGGGWSSAGAISLVNSAPLRSGLYQSSYKPSYNRIDWPMQTINYDYSSSLSQVYFSFWMYRDYPAWSILLGNGSNNKFWRIYQNSIPSGDILASAVDNGDLGVPGNIYACNELAIGRETSYDGTLTTLDYSAASAFFYSPDKSDVRSWSGYTPHILPSLQAWDHYEVYLTYPTTRGGGDGSALFIVNGLTHSRVSHAGFDHATDTDDFRWFRFGGVSGENVTDPSYEYLDQIYIDNTVAHVFVSNRNDVTWPDSATAHHSEIQVPSAWSDNSITFTLNQGSFQNGQSVYLYIVDKNGNINASGYPVTIGGGQLPDTTPPAPPSGVMVI